MLHTAPLLLALLAASPADLGPVAENALRVYLVRHGQALTNLSPPPDLPPEQLDRLTALGHGQSKAAGAALLGRGVALIVSSPKGRARETAEDMAEALRGVPLWTDGRLGPLELGRAANGPLLEWDDRMRHWQAGRDPVPASGESLEQLGQRLLQVLSELKQEFSGKSVVFVSHSEVIANFLGMIEGGTLAGRFDVRIANGSICGVEAPAASLPRVLLVNFLPAEKKTEEVLGAGASRAAARRLAAP